MKIGILGGTFDPIHLGHLIVAEEARVRLGLEEVLFVPTGKPWMKEGTPVSEAKHRLNMARLAISTNPFFRLSAMEIERPGPSYTVDTLTVLREEYGPEAEMFFILGVDSLAGFHEWKEPRRILEMATLVAVTRPGYEVPQTKVFNGALGGMENRLKTLDGVRVEISGRDLRRRVKEGLSIRYRVCSPVGKYIYDHGLYLDRVKNE
ncbi:MAG: nicotinate-nucleotide adenylyltransferase [SAR202 cluster bacterium]|nr:nicotinate-nucleotide adenylyltransferase [SAR202 cluster bacterium]